MIHPSDIVEMKIDRITGEFSMRIFRNFVWIDFGVAFQEDSFKTGDLYFAFSLYRQGDGIEIVDKPIGFST